MTVSCSGSEKQGLWHNSCFSLTLQETVVICGLLHGDFGALGLFCRSSGIFLLKEHLPFHHECNKLIHLLRKGIYLLREVEGLLQFPVWGRFLCGFLNFVWGPKSNVMKSGFQLPRSYLNFSDFLRLGDRLCWLSARSTSNPAHSRTKPANQSGSGLEGKKSTILPAQSGLRPFRRLTPYLIHGRHWFAFVEYFLWGLHMTRYPKDCNKANDGGWIAKTLYFDILLTVWRGVVALLDERLGFDIQPYARKIHTWVAVRVTTMSLVHGMAHWIWWVI